MVLKEEALVQCGLTKNEAKVYVALLTLGSATAVEITKQSKVHRVNVYDVLERLQKKGLISTIMQAAKRIYEAANPQQLQQLLKHKEEVLQSIMPQLEQAFTIKKEKQQVHHFFGPEGVMRAYYMVLEENKTLYALGGSGLNRKYLKHRHEMWNKERKKKGIRIKALYFEPARRDTPWNDSTVSLRYLPKKYTTIGMIDICGDLVVNLIPVERSIAAIVIENKVLADSYRMLFELIWSKAVP